MKVYKNICIVFAAALLGGACGNNIDGLADRPEDYSRIYMARAAGDTINSFIMSDREEVLTYGAGFGGLDAPDGDITVHFKADTALVRAYNNENYTNYPMLPEAGFSLEATSAVIRKGEWNTPALKVKLKTSGVLDGVGIYLLPVTIESASGPAKINESLRTTYFLVRATYGSNPFTMFNRSGWTAKASIQANNTTRDASLVLDGDDETSWETPWAKPKPLPPYWITIDMKEARKLHGMVITGRMENGQPREWYNPRDIVLETSVDGQNWDAASFQGDYSEAFRLELVLKNTIYLAYAQEARYFRITVNASYGDQPGTHIHEIEPF